MNFDLIVLLFGLLLLAALIGLFVYAVIKSPPTSKPWWAPDARASVAAAVIFMAAVVLFYRMTHASTVDDKVLDMMLTILFGTAFVAIVNFLFGSSRNADNKDDTINKIALMPTPPAANAPADQSAPPAAPAPTPAPPSAS